MRPGDDKTRHQHKRVQEAQVLRRPQQEKRAKHKPNATNQSNNNSSTSGADTLHMWRKQRLRLRIRSATRSRRFSQRMIQHLWLNASIHQRSRSTITSHLTTHDALLLAQRLDQPHYLCAARSLLISKTHDATPLAQNTPRRPKKKENVSARVSQFNNASDNV